MLITQKSNWLGIAEENHDILTFRNRKDVRDHLIKPIILDVREMRTRKEKWFMQDTQRVSLSAKP